MMIFLFTFLDIAIFLL